MKHIHFSLNLWCSSLLGAALFSTASAATVSYWQLDEASGSLNDAVGSNDLSEATGGSGLTYSQTALVNPVPNPDGTVGAANPSSVSFSSATDAMSTSNVSPFNLSSSSSFTFEGFFQHTITDGSQSGIEAIGGDRQGLSGDAEGDTFRGWYVNFNSGRVQFYYDDRNAADDANEQFSITSSSAAGDRYDDGGVHHFAAVWDHSTGSATEGTMTLYVNGDLIGSQVVTGLDVYTSSGFTVGGRSTTSANNDFDDSIFNGTLDELRFSDEALAPSEFLNVPEPSSSLMLISGIGLLCLLRRRK